MAGGRTSTRSSVTRGTPSSPSRTAPIRRTGRLTRSQSAELEVSGNAEVSRKVATKHASQPPSAHSIDSDENASARSRNVTRSAVARKMSTVDEGVEPAIRDRSEEQDVIGSTGEVEHASSIGEDSQASAITATSATSFGVGIYQDLDPSAIIQSLPRLLRLSRSILELLPTQTVESTVKELQVPGQSLPALMHLAENKFNEVRKAYGPGDFINTEGILRRLFGSRDLGVGDFRPDPIFQAANLAILAKNIMVLKSENRSASFFLEGLDTLFAKPFSTGFAADTMYGQSALRDETFSLALELRTQWVVSHLYWKKTNEAALMTVGYPYEALYGAFRTDSPIISVPHFVTEDGTGSLKIMAGVLSEFDPPKFQEQAAKIRERIAQIEVSFHGEEAGGNEFYDESKLSQDFPWLEFQKMAVAWCQARLQEIDDSIDQQGDVSNIARSLASAMQEANENVHASRVFSQEDNDLELISPDITPAGSGKSLYSGKKSVQALARIKAARQTPSTASVSKIATMSSNGPQHSFPSNTTINSGKSDPSGHISRSHDDNMAMPSDNDQDLFVGETSREEYVALHKQLSNEKNKENIIAKADKPRRLIDHQPGAHKVSWDEESQAGKIDQSNRKRTVAESDDEDAFQQDRSVPDKSRRKAAPNAQPKERDEGPHSPRKRLRQSSTSEKAREEIVTSESSYQESEVETDDGTSKPHGQIQVSLQNSDDEDPRPDPSQAAEVAKRRTFLATQAKRLPQRRVPWSDYDEFHLLDLIVAHGCSWAHIAKIADFEHPRDQVALKDKARNMKVKFLKAGTQLPTNFNIIALGQKEIATVRRVVPDYGE